MLIWNIVIVVTVVVAVFPVVFLITATAVVCVIVFTLNIGWSSFSPLPISSDFYYKVIIQ